MLAQFFLGQQVTDKDTALQRLNRQITRADRPARAGDDQPQDARGQSHAPQRHAARRREAEKSRLQGLIGFEQRQRGHVGAARRARSSKAARAEKQVSARALAQVEILNQQIAALRRQLAALEEALDASEQRDREVAGPHRRSRLAAQRGARPAGAGAGPLPLRLLRPPAAGARQPARHPHRRRPLRVPVGGVLRSPARPALKPAGQAELDKLAAALVDLDKQIPGRHPLGAARRRPHRQAAALGHRPVHDQLGAVRRRAPSPSCSI